MATLLLQSNVATVTEGGIMARQRGEILFAKNLVEINDSESKKNGLADRVRDA